MLTWNLEDTNLKEAFRLQKDMKREDLHRIFSFLIISLINGSCEDKGSRDAILIGDYRIEL